VYVRGDIVFYQNLNSYSKIDGKTGQVQWTSNDVGIGLGHAGETSTHYIVYDDGELFFLNKNSGELYARLSTSKNNTEFDVIRGSMCVDEESGHLVYSDNNDIVCVELP
tara:strand:- start:2007 stop:2333 length:327 start_codon:yes stop_codon:yes gene_type:complete